MHKWEDDAGQAGHSVPRPLPGGLELVWQALSRMNRENEKIIEILRETGVRLVALEQKVDSLSERLASSGGSLTAAIFKIDALARTVESWGEDKKSVESPSTIPTKLRLSGDNIVAALYQMAMDIENAD